MKINITNEVMQEPVTPNSYTVHFKTMSGDADAHETNKITTFIKGEDDRILESLLTLLEALKASFLNGRGQHTEYSDVPGFNDWFGGELNQNETSTFIEETNQFTAAEWPYDIIYDREQRLIKYWVTYYDADGTQFNTQIEL